MFRVIELSSAATAPCGRPLVNVGIPVPSSFFPFSGHKQSFFGDKHALGRDGVDFFMQIKAVTIQWYSEEEKRVTRLSTREGRTNRR